MSKIVRISDENYDFIECMAFRNGVPINAILNEVLEKFKNSSPNDVISVEYRGRKLR